MDIKPSSVHLFHKIGHIDTNGLTHTTILKKFEIRLAEIFKILLHDLECQ